MFVILITVIVGIPLGHAISLFQPYYVVAAQGQVSLHCTYKRPEPKIMQVSVYKGMYGEEQICGAYVNVSNPHIMTNGRLQCIVNVSKGRVDLIIFGLRGEDTDLYRCQVDVIFPPPYIKMIGNGTLVYIPESPNCSTEHTQARIQEDQKTSASETHTQARIQEDQKTSASETHTQARIQEDQKTSASETQDQSYPKVLLYAILIITITILILQLMKMFLYLHKSTSVQQALSQKDNYSNFW